MKNMKKQDRGISLISLIITIIVIIILGAVVIFSGMGTPEKAQLSAIISDMDNVQTAVDQAYYGFYTEKSVAGEVWTKSQFYEAVATGETSRENLKGVGIVPISDSSMVKMTLPKYEGRSWGVAVEDIDDHTRVGSVVLLPGYETDGKIYATLLDVQNDGRDTESMDNAISKVNNQNVVSNLELSYQNGYAVGVLKITSGGDEQLKKMVVEELKKQPDLTVEFETFEELCNILGVSEDVVLNSLRLNSISMTNAKEIGKFQRDDKIFCYGIPESTGEIKLENIITKESKSIFLLELSQYVINIEMEDGLSYWFSLRKLENGSYADVNEDYEVVIKINGTQRYSGTAKNKLNYFYNYASELSRGDVMEVDIEAVIDGNVVTFKGICMLGIPG